MNFFISISSLSSLTTADVNGDNKLDVIVAEMYGKVRIFLNTGNGTFNNQANYATGNLSIATSSFVTAADLNGDNKPDIIVINADTSIVYVFLNTGTGMFNLRETYPTGPKSRPTSLTTADVDGDKNLDIIVTNHGTGRVGVFRNTGNGTFHAQVTYSTGTKSTPDTITTADVNGDNKPDIIVANYGAGNVGVFFNTGNGRFSDQVIYPTGFGSSPGIVTATDVDGDEKPDIIVANESGHTVGVFLNLGNGTFKDQVIYSTRFNSNPNSITTADVNGDNKPDIIVPNHATRIIDVFLNTGNGTFNDRVIYLSGLRSGGPICFTKRDIDGNDVLDSIFAVPDAAGVRLSLRRRN
jgi:hypothetical protein